MARGVVAAGVRATFGVMTVIYASPRGNDRNDGATPETPVSRVRAFASAAPGVKVELANGVYDDALGYTYKTDEGVVIHMSVASQRRVLRALCRPRWYLLNLPTAVVLQVRHYIVGRLSFDTLNRLRRLKGRFRTGKRLTAS